ncbi:hypothetical protein LguiA_007454 [Lonicera macranthoides]
MRVPSSTMGISQFLGLRLNPPLLTLRICLIEFCRNFLEAARAHDRKPLMTVKVVVVCGRLTSHEPYIYIYILIQVVQFVSLLYSILYISDV